MNTSIIIATTIALLTGFVGSTYYTLHTLKPSTEAEGVKSTMLPKSTPTTLPSEAVSDQEKEDLLFMREEEKLARDVYQTLYETWKLPIFSNIAQSEQTHTEAIRKLLETYTISDPVSDDTVGIFQNTKLQSLYTTLVAQGLASEIEALKVGIMIEELDIKDISEAVTRTDNADIALVYENLTRGSRNHLRSFYRQLSNRGVSYEPQYISTEEFQTIITSETGRGRSQLGKPLDGRGIHSHN
jgi:hypothetical protein